MNHALPARRDGQALALMVLTMLVFGAQDALSRLLGERYPITFVLMVRFWFFAAFALAYAARRGGIRRTLRSHAPALQVARGVLIVGQLILIVYGFVAVGLVETHAIFACYPLVIAAMARFFLHEAVSARRWAAIATGAVGVLVILRPGLGSVSVDSLIVLGAAILFAAYSVLTRRAAEHDSPDTSFLYTGLVAALILTIIGLPMAVPIRPEDVPAFATLCISGALGHFLLIQVYVRAPANVVQPLAYLQLVFASAFGVLAFGEPLRATTVIGAAIVIAAGLFALAASRRGA